MTVNSNQFVKKYKEKLQPKLALPRCLMKDLDQE